MFTPSPIPTHTGCACVPHPADPDPTTEADLMQARSIAGGLARYGIGPDRWSTAVDPEAGGAVLRVCAEDGTLVTLVIPAPGAPFPVHRNRRRVAALDARRVYGTRDAHVAALFVAYMRDRAALELPRVDSRPRAQNVV
ncbi:hypothetical protein ACN20G_11905 [Streptomyces sp. BI20]|uniref:hypothetical protein n=1 Tax=Streptomyces sp. BI20 TaxID=3403460 RepID=UPI003C759DE7